MITHKEYMADSRNLHQAYYLEIARAAYMQLSDDLLARVKRSQDEHINDIALNVWDVAAAPYRAALQKTLKARGTFWSLSVGVCAAKALARELVK